MRDGRRFRQTVTFGQRTAGRALPRLEHVDRARRAAAVVVADELEPVLPRFRMVQQRDEHGRHGGEVGRTELLDRREHGVGIVLRMDHLLRTDPQAHHHADRERVDVEVRDHDEVAFLAAEDVGRVRPRDRLHHVREDVPVRQHRPLRRPRRPAGVLEDRQIAGAHDGHPDADAGNAGAWHVPGTCQAPLRRQEIGERECAVAARWSRGCR